MLADGNGSQALQLVIPQHRLPGSSPRSGQFFRDRFCLREQIKIIRASGFGVGSRQIEPSKRMGAHHRSGALAVEIKIAHLKFLPRAIELYAIRCINRARQSEFRVVRNLESVFEIARANEKLAAAEISTPA